MKIITNLSPCEVSERARSSAIVIAEQELYTRAVRCGDDNKKEIDVRKIDIRVDEVKQLTVIWVGTFLTKDAEVVKESGTEVYSSRDY